MTNRPLFALVTVLLLPASLSAQDPPARESLDKVTLQLEGKSSRLIVSGKILDYTGDSLRMRTRLGDSVRSYPRSQVVSVETPQVKSHVDALRKFARQEYTAARDLLQRAIDEEPREWVRREILALLVRCHLQTGDRLNAGSRFIALARSDPSTRHYNLAPLIWDAGNISPALKTTAEVWLRRTSEPEQLLGASVLLHDQRFGDLAETELRKLTTSGNGQIRTLARAQLWRTRLRGGQPSELEVDLWQSEIDRMPEWLRGGPYYLLGQGYLQHREEEHAATALLWLPFVYRHDHYLAARACLEAAEAMQRNGRLPQARTLYREVIFRYEETPYAGEASAALKNLDNPGADADTTPGGSRETQP